MECYNCGRKLSKKEATKEHIPARALFTGYGNEFKVNRLTVPACLKCNNEYSKIDQELRNAIGVTNDDVDDESARELSRKAVKSILNQRNWKNRIFLDFGGKVEAVQFDYSKFKKAVIKDFKGIFHDEFGFALPSSWKVEIISQFEKDGKLQKAASEIFQYLAKGITWKQSGHEAIFKYKFKTMAPDENGVLYDSDDLDDADNLACVQFYHERMGFIVVASRRTFLNAKFPLRQFRLKRKKGIK